MYILQPDYLVRPYFAAGALVRFLFPSEERETEFGIDEVSPFGFFPVIGLELALQMNLKLFAEYQPTFYFIIDDPDLLREYYNFIEIFEENRPPHWVIGPFLFDPTSFNIGVRWLLPF